MIRERLDKHLKRACPRPELKRLVHLFFDDLGEYYAGKTFKREDFETIEVDGKVVEQDVVKRLFRDKDEVTAEETFVELFIENVALLDYSNFLTDTFISRNAGFYDMNTSRIGIKKYQKTKVQPTGDTESSRSSKKLTSKEKKLIKKQEEWVNMLGLADYVKETVPDILYHELSHIFGCKSFMGGKYRLMDSSSQAIMISGLKSYVLSGNKINSELIKEAKKRKVTICEKIETEEDLFLVSRLGGVAIAEILNEVISKKITKTLLVEKTDDYSLQRGARQKKKLVGNCDYNVNYDIAKLLELFIGEEELKGARFNFDKIIESVNGIKIDPGLLESLQKALVATMSNDELVQQKLLDSIKSCDVYDFLSKCVGMGDVIIDESNYIKNDLKDICHIILVEGIKSSILEKINNPDIKKDEEFFKEIIATLSGIDDCICYSIDTCQVGNELQTCLTGDIQTTKSLADYYRQHATSHRGRDIILLDEISDAVSICATENGIDLPTLEVDNNYFQQQQIIAENERTKQLEEEREQQIIEERQKREQQLEEESGDVPKKKHATKKGEKMEGIS